MCYNNKRYLFGAVIGFDGRHEALAASGRYSLRTNKNK